MAILFSIVINLAIILVFLRFIMQLSVSNVSNPVVQACIKATRVIDVINKDFPKPAKGRVNLAALLVLLMLCLFRVWGFGELRIGMEVFDQFYENLAASPINLIYGTLLSMVDSLLSFCKFVMIGAILMSFVALISESTGPLNEVIQDLAEPLFAPFRKILPNMGMLDFSPLLALLIFDVIYTAMQFASQNILGGVY